MFKILRAIRDWAAAWVSKMQQHLSPNKFLGLLSILVGCIAGFSAAILKDLISALSELVKGVVPNDEYNILLLVVPVIGIVLCGIYCRYIVKDDMEFGCERVADALKSGQPRLRRHIMYAPIVACTLTIGFGGSAGSEGPIAYAGAGIGSNIGKYFKLSDQTISMLVIIGASAGIAGIFKAPVGGAMFALEVLCMPMTTMSMIALMLACLASGCVAYAWSGFNIDITYLPKNFFDPSMIWAVIILGVFCGLYSIYYSYFLAKTERVFKKMTNPWVKNVISGIVIGVLLFVFPVLYGEGYSVLDQIINGNLSTLMRDTALYDAHGPWVLMLFLVGTIAVKSIATATTNSGGGVGGDFAPTLFAGCFAGLLFAYFSNTVFGTHLNEANCAFFGMAGVMSGAIQAPLMAIFLTTEMVGDFSMFFPVTFCALFSFATVRLFHRNWKISIRPTWLHGVIKKL